MIDTRRIGRDAPGVGNTQAGGDFFTQTGVFADESRHILGETQQQWLFDRLSENYPWRFLGNSVTFSQIKVSPGTEADGQSVYANPDQWDGYKAARDRVFDHIENSSIDNLVICTGDVHASLVAEVSRDPNNSSHYVAGTGMGSVATEFVTPSISSGGDPKDPDSEDPEGSGESIAEGQLGTILAASNPHSRYAQIGLNGYMIMDVTAQRVQAEYWHVPEVEQINDGLTNTINFVVNSGTAATNETQDPATGNRPNTPPFAP
jgi:alkaline phosphatase D